MSDYDDGELSILNSIYETETGQPFNEWIVTDDGVPEGWWGEGYVIRTVDPVVVFKWGFTDPSTNSGMSAGFPFNDGKKFLSVLFLHAVSAKDPLDVQEQIHDFRMTALQAVIEKLSQRE
jgi:hypothetical protein